MEIFMAGFNWEDPFGEESSDKELHVWIPGQPVPPVDIRLVHERQAKLLPQLEAVRDTALEVLKNKIRKDYFSSSVLREGLQRNLHVEAWHRRTDCPGVVDSLPMMFNMHDYPIAIEKIG